MEELNSSTLMSEDVENEEEQTSEEIVQEEVKEPAADETSNEEVENEVEEQPQGKFYTDEEFNKAVNEIADRRVARKMKKLERELDKYKDTENVLKSQLGGENIDEVNSKLRELYSNEGVELPERYVSEDKDYIEFQATRDSEDFISEGYESMKNEANRLANIGYDNLNSKDKIVFTKICEALERKDNENILKSMNVDSKILDDKDFIEYKNQFNRNVPISRIYEMYSGNKEEVEIKTPGDLTNNSSNVDKDFFTDEEIEKMTDEEIEKNWDKIRLSQTRNK